MITRVFSPFPTLTNDRLRLRQFEQSDAAAIATLRSDPVVNKYLDRPKACSIDKALQHINSFLDGITDGEWIIWGIGMHDSPTLIGTICLWQFSPDGQMAEVGYELLSTYHRQGVMRETMQLVIDYAKEQLQIDTIEAYTHRENLASINLLTSVGFELEEGRNNPDEPNDIIYARRS